MRRTTSTAKTRGMVTRIITTTKAMLRCYDNETHQTDDYEVEIIGTVNTERQLITRVYSTGVLDKHRYTILEVLNLEQFGTLYAMDIDTFLEHAVIIEQNITD